eukprot:gene14403-biopygen12783
MVWVHVGADHARHRASVQWPGQGSFPGLDRRGRAQARPLGQVGDAFVAITSGAKGCYWSDRGTIRHTPAVEVSAIDTLAAGDVFHAAFAVGVVEGWPTERTIRFASAAAAIKCTRFGGRLGAPTRAEVEAIL